MRRPVRFCLCIASLASTMTVVGGRGASTDSLLSTKSTTEVEDGNVLRLFFEEMVRAIENGTWRPRHATILSRLKKDIDAAMPFCEKYSCFSGTRLKKFRGSKAFNSNSLMVWFPSSAEFANTDSKGLKNYRDILLMRGSVPLEKLTALFRSIEIAKIGQVNIVVDEGSTVKLYAPRPTAGCKIATRLIIAWRPGDKIPEIPLRRFEWSVSYRDCVVTVSTTNQMPATKVENVAGRMTITGGVEGKILMLAAEKMNFIIEVNHVASTSDANVSMQQKIVNDVIEGRSHLGIGQIRMTDRIAKSSVTIVDTRRDEHVCWCIPRFLGEENNLITFEFSWSVWILILFVFAVIIGCEHVSSSLSRANLEASRRRERGGAGILITRETLRNRDRSAIRRKPRGWGRTILEVFSMCLGYPVFVDPITTSARILLFTYLYYVMVMTTAYKTSLSSVLTVGNDKPLITDANGIIAANLTTGGEIEELEVLKDQVDATPANRELIRRYVVYPTLEAARKRLNTSRDFAYLSLWSDLTYNNRVWVNVDEYSRYQILRDTVLTYNSVIIWQPHTALQMPIENILLRCREAGIIKHWNSMTMNSKIGTAMTADTVVKLQNRRGTFAKYSWIFLHYVTCILISSLVFLAELLVVHKFT